MNDKQDWIVKETPELTVIDWTAVFCWASSKPGECITIASVEKGDTVSADFATGQIIIKRKPPAKA